MKRILVSLSIVIFSIFIESQVTEGLLSVPYWKSLSNTEFYEYYSTWGPSINKYYSILTIISVLLPISYSIYYAFHKSSALKYFIASAFFAVLILGFFFVYFKNINQQFYAASFNDDQLNSVLHTWGFLHWARVLVEFLSLSFFLIAVNKDSSIIGEKCFYKHY